MPEGEVIVLVNMSDKQVRNVHTYLWTLCTTPFIKKDMAGQQRGVFIASARLNRSSFRAWGWEEVALLGEAWGV